MRICFVSDLHVDIGSQPLIVWPEADVLVVAGDTANSIGEVEKFFRKLERRCPYEHIVFVDGNHEHYSNAPTGRTLDETLDRIEELLPERVVMLPQTDYHKIGDLYFIGRNGWYSMDAAGDPMANRARWRDVMNDNRWIGFDKLNILPPWELAMRDARMIEFNVEAVLRVDPTARFAIVTHTSPCRETLSQRPEHLLDNSFYANLHMQEVMRKFSSHIVVWAHGHTHFRQERIVEGVLVVVNPRGYPSENPSWEPVVYDL